MYRTRGSIFIAKHMRGIKTEQIHVYNEKQKQNRTSIGSTKTTI